MPAMTTVKIDAKGHWLRADAAASYARMLAAGMPTVGLVVAGRTYAEQKALYAAYLAGHGNLAAKPGTSLHESGLAMDVTRQSPQQLWLVKGSSATKVTSYGTTRAAAYGWLRTVPSEAWHFRYYPDRDKHRNDKPVVKPPVVVVPPVVTPPKPSIVPTLARLSTLNCHGWNVRESAWTSRAKASILAEIARLSCSIYALTECPEYMRDEIRAKRPGGAARWKVATRGDGLHQCVLFDSHKWKFGTSEPVTFGPTSYHGGVWATFTQTITRATLAVGAYHLPPNVVSSDAKQESYLRGFLASAPRVTARIAGGDGADSSTWASGWLDARVIAAASTTYSTGTYGNAIRDRVFLLGATVRAYTVGPVIAGTDHRSVLVNLTIPATIPSN